MTKLTDEQIELLKRILIDDGCQCVDEHDELEDATSLNCLAGIALRELEIRRAVVGD